MSVPNIPNWSVLTTLERADAVLDWCLEQGIETASILDYQLDAAMNTANALIAEQDGIDYEPSPVDYVHMIRVLAAFLRSRI